MSDQDTRIVQEAEKLAKQGQFEAAVSCLEKEIQSYRLINQRYTFSRLSPDEKTGHNVLRTLLS